MQNTVARLLPLVCFDFRGNETITFSWDNDLFLRHNKHTMLRNKGLAVSHSSCWTFYFMVHTTGVLLLEDLIGPLPVTAGNMRRSMSGSILSFCCCLMLLLINRWGCNVILRLLYLTDRYIVAFAWSTKEVGASVCRLKLLASVIGNQGTPPAVKGTPVMSEPG